MSLSGRHEEFAKKMLKGLDFVKFRAWHSHYRPAQKCLVLPPGISQICEGVAVFDFLFYRVEELAIITAVTASHIVCGFLPHMRAF
jgi:hypothetical protein